MRPIILCCIACALLFQGCATTSLPPVTAATPKGFTFEDDEKQLWKTSEEEQKKLDSSGLVLGDVELESYVNSVAARLHPPDPSFKIPFRIVVLKNYYLNAFAYPNGVIYVHTGILAQMENEAQLATLLAHEMTHCTHRHTAQEFRDLKNKATFNAAFQVFLGGFGWGLAGLLGQVGTIASVQGYSRAMENEADTEGFKLMVKAGYDPAEAVRIFEILKKDADSRKVKEPFFFGSHPKLQDRIDNYTNLRLTSGKKDGIKNAELFLAKTKKGLRTDAELNMRAGNFMEAQKELEKYVKVEPGPEAYYLLGEVSRQQGGARAIETAKGYYEKAVNAGPEYPEPYRELGLIYYKAKDKQAARKYFESYLARAPNAKDRGYIEMYLKRSSE